MKLPLTRLSATVAIVAGVVMTGCEPPSAAVAPVGPVQVPQQGPSSRFAIQHHTTFHAGFENNQRDVLTMTDTLTGREYIIVTDASIAEVQAKKKRDAEAVQDAVDTMLSIEVE